MTKENFIKNDIIQEQKLKKEELYGPKQPKQPKQQIVYDRHKKTIVYDGIHPYISIDPETGMRVEVATATEDIKNRQEYARRYGVPVEKVAAPPPKGTSDQEREKRMKLMEKIQVQNKENKEIEQKGEEN